MNQLASIYVVRPTENGHNFPQAFTRGEVLHGIAPHPDHPDGDMQVLHITGYIHNRLAVQALLGCIHPECETRIMATAVLGDSLSQERKIIDKVGSEILFNIVMHLLQRKWHWSQDNKNQ